MDTNNFIRLYKKGDLIIVWCDGKKQSYWYYKIREALRLFKDKFNIRKRHFRVDYCPYLLN